MDSLHGRTPPATGAGKMRHYLRRTEILQIGPVVITRHKSGALEIKAPETMPITISQVEPPADSHSDE